MPWWGQKNRNKIKNTIVYQVTHSYLQKSLRRNFKANFQVRHLSNVKSISGNRFKLLIVLFLHFNILFCLLSFIKRYGGKGVLRKIIPSIPLNSTKAKRQQKTCTIKVSTNNLGQISYNLLLRSEFVMFAFWWINKGCGMQHTFPITSVISFNKNIRFCWTMPTKIWFYSHWSIFF